MDIKTSSGHYDDPHEAVRGHSSNSEGAEEFRHAKLLCDEIDKSLANAGKVRYCRVGPGAVDPEVRQAAERAKELFCWWAGPGLSGINIVWMREESLEERKYFSLYPQDRGNPELDDTLFEMDRPISGLATPLDDSIYIHADLSVGQVERVVAHELQHKRQKWVSREQSEADACQVADTFCRKFYPLSEPWALSLQELAYLGRLF